jgi:Icc-related predicted phosphoesterase
MKVLAFSDLHCDLAAAERLVVRSDDADILIGAGDFASVHEGLDEALEGFSVVDPPFLLVPGNNETEDALREAASRVPTNTRVLHGEGGSFEEVSFFALGAGIPTTPWDWSFDLSEEEAAERLEGMPEGLDLLILHSPPHGHCDVSGQGEHLGSRAILEAIEAKQPGVAVCGHIHESWGQESRIGDTRVINLGPDGRLIDLG